MVCKRRQKTRRTSKTQGGDYKPPCDRPLVSSLVLRVLCRHLQATLSKTLNDPVTAAGQRTSAAGAVAPDKLSRVALLYVSKLQVASSNDYHDTFRVKVSRDRAEYTATLYTGGVSGSPPRVCLDPAMRRARRIDDHAGRAGRESVGMNIACGGNRGGRCWAPSIFSLRLPALPCQVRGLVRCQSWSRTIYKRA